MFKLYHTNTKKQHKKPNSDKFQLTYLTLNYYWCDICVLIRYVLYVLLNKSTHPQHSTDEKRYTLVMYRIHAN